MVDAKIGDRTTQGADANAKLSVGKPFAGRYLIESQLGHGAMGAVYRAFDKNVGEHVALKVLHSDVGSSNLERFRREVRLARRITHWNIARTFDLGEHQSTHYLTMEFVAGTTLRETIQARAPMPAVEAIPIAMQIAEGLQAAHEAGVVHRDLKPANVLVAHGGRIVITDFGIARSVRGRDATLDTNGIIGTPAYMSPEQVAGDEADAPTDIYALGLIMYEVLTARLPFDDTSGILQVAQRVTEPPKHPQEHVPMSDVLAQLLLRCLERDVAARPTAGELVRALRQLDPGKEGTAAARPSAPDAADDVVPLWSATPNHALGAWSNVLFLVFRRETTEAAIDELGQGLRRLGARHPRGIGLITIVEQTAPPPSTEARKAMVGVLTAAEHLRCSAVVFEGTGFRAAIVRSFVAGLNMMVRLPYPHHVFASVEGSAQWLIDGLSATDGANMKPGELVHALVSARRGFRL